MDRVLFVDDEFNVLNGFKRQFRKDFQISLALNGEEALGTLKEDGDPIAVIISDQSMPGLSGIGFFEKAIELSPDSVRVMLTGNADQQTAIDAANRAQVFRFLQKPCDRDTLLAVIQEGVQLFKQRSEERTLLRDTLSGSIQVLSETLSLVNPEAFGLAQRVRRVSRHLVNKLGLAEVWQFDLAAMLSQLGCVCLSRETMQRYQNGWELSDDEQAQLTKVPQIGARLLGKVPRLEEVTGMIERQNIDYHGRLGAYSLDPEEFMQLGGHMLKLAIEYDRHRRAGCRHSQCMDRLKAVGKFHPGLMELMLSYIPEETTGTVKDVTLAQLRPGMLLAEEIKAGNGSLLAIRNQEVNELMLDRLEAFADTVGVREPIRILSPE